VIKEKSPQKFKQTMIIFNPRAGDGRPLSSIFQYFLRQKHRKIDIYKSKDQYRKIIECFFDDNGLPYKLVKTEFSGQATEIAKECVSKGYDLVIAVGGDGTVNEVINGLAGSSVTLGVIPMGTANIFALQLNYPFIIQEACEKILNGQVREMDLGICNERYFSCYAGVGFDAQIYKATDSKLKKLFGALAYVFMAAWQVLSYKFQPILIKTDKDAILRKAYFVIVGNGCYYIGKNVLSDPDSLSDGLLNVCIFKQRNFWSLFGYLIGVWEKIYIST